MRATDVVARHAELVDRTSDWRVQRVIDGHLQTRLGLDAGGNTQKQARDTGVGKALHNGLKVAKTYHVETQMWAQVERRADDLPEADVVSNYIEPGDYGFAVLESPWHWTEARGRGETTHAITWSPFSWMTTSLYGGPPIRKFGILTAMWLDTRRDVDDIYKLMVDDPETAKVAREWFGDWAICDVAIHAFSEKMGPQFMGIDDKHRQVIIDNGDTPYEGGLQNTRRVFCQLWGMLSEVLPGIERETDDDVDRRTRKFARRMRIPTQVEMVKLRREQTPTLHPGTGAPISCRYHVDPFKRVIGRGTENERVIWVRGHDRGPEHAPWSQRQRVHNLSR